MRGLKRGSDCSGCSYGTLVSDFKKSGDGEVAEEKKVTGKDDVKGKGKAKVKPKKKQGLYEVEWFRIGRLGTLSLSIASADFVILSSRRGSFVQESVDAEREGKLRASWRAALVLDGNADRQVRFELRSEGLVLICCRSRLEDLYSLLHFIQLEPWGALLVSVLRQH